LEDALSVLIVRQQAVAARHPVSEHENAARHPALGDDVRAGAKAFLGDD
jgi:hypothetical protein